MINLLTTNLVLISKHGTVNKADNSKVLKARFDIKIAKVKNEAKFQLSI